VSGIRLRDMAFSADLLFGAFDRLKEFVDRKDKTSAEERQRLIEALSESVHVADETIHYIAQRRRGTARDDEKELALSGKWADAGVKLAALGARDLADRYFLKAQFWADPDRWTDADVERARIKLEEIST